MEIGNDIHIINSGRRPTPVTLHEPEHRLEFYHGKRNRFLVVYQGVSSSDVPQNQPSDSSVVNSLDYVKPHAKERREVTQSLVENTKKLRSFIVEDIAPRVLATRQAWEEAQVVLRELTGVSDLALESEEGLYTHALRLGVNIKIADWVSKYLSLSKEDASVLYGLLFSPHHKQPDDMSKLTALLQTLVTDSPSVNPTTKKQGRASRVDPTFGVLD